MIGDQLQKAIFAALKTSPAVADGGIYDQPPADAAFPYVTIGDDQVLDDGNTCGDGWEVFSDVHVWSRSVAGSKLEAKQIRAEIVTRLTALIDVQDFAVVIASLETARTFRDPDGMTEHAVLTFKHTLQPA